MNEKLAWFMKELTTLCAAAEACGVLLRVDNISVPPLTQGNLRMQVHVRAAHVPDTPIQRQPATEGVYLRAPGLCNKAPKGWACTLPAGHEHSCHMAAVAEVPPEPCRWPKACDCGVCSRLDSRGGQTWRPTTEPYCPRCRKGFDVCICNEAGAH